MSDLHWMLIRALVGDRRRSGNNHLTPAAERVAFTNRQAEIATAVARRYGKTPEDLFDYRRADAILGGHPYE